MNNKIMQKMQAVVPAGFAAYDQFIICRLVPNERTGKFDKVPCDARGNRRDAHDRTSWLRAIDAFTIVANSDPALMLHVGFVFAPCDPFWFIDLDGAYRPSDGAWSHLALNVLSHFPGCAVEVSLSNTGLHLFGSGEVDEHRKKRTLAEYDGAAIEFYSEYRFVLLTGFKRWGDASVDFTLAMPGFITRFGLEAEPEPEPITWTYGAAPGANPWMDDRELITRMCDSAGSARSQFGQGAHPRDLWTGNAEALRRFYPPINNVDQFDRSAADLGLMNHLYYWTGGDIARAVRLHNASAIGRPDKYAARPALMTRLLNKSAGVVKTFHNKDYRSASALNPMNGGVSQAVATHHPAGYQPTPTYQPANTPQAVAAASWGLEQTGAALPILKGFCDAYTMDAIMAMDLPEPTYLVEELLSTGVFFLIGKPKKGKSWMMMELALNVAVGGHFLGRKCRQGRVIYFALEDNRRRMKNRMKLMQPASFVDSTNGQLQVLTMEDKVQGMDQGFLDRLRQTLTNSSGHALVIVDTLSKVRFSKRPGQSVYDYDRAPIDPLTELCTDFPNLTIIVVHHSRKAESEDPYDLANGSMGLTGAADGTFVLAMDHQNHTMVFHATGRDIEPTELAVKLEPPRWIVLGDPDEVGLGDMQIKIVDLLTSHGAPMRSGEIHAALGTTPSNISQRLAAMMKRNVVVKTKSGYMLVHK